MQVEFVDRVFTKTGAGDDAEEAKARAAEAAKKKEMSKSKVSSNGKYESTKRQNDLYNEVRSFLRVH